MKTEKSKDNRLVFITELVWKNWQVLLYAFDREGKTLSFPSFCAEAEKAVLPSDVEMFWKESQGQEHPIVHIEKQGSIYGWVFREEDTIFFLGPLCSAPLSFAQERGFLHQRKIRRKDFPIREYTVLETFPMVSMVYLAVTGKVFDEMSWYDQAETWRSLERDEVQRRIPSEEEKDRTHLPYRTEQEWYRGIWEGRNVSAILEMEGRGSDIMDHVGILAEGDALKQVEYTIAAQITLATRAAIDGGVSPVKAYGMSDLFFRKLAQCSQLAEIMRLAGTVQENFARAVREAQAEAERDVDVERCKDYIALHLTEKLSVTRMAEELQISYSYLASKFQKITGTSIKKYIVREKLRAVTNQLKYSDANIGEIADYFSFSSSSSMGVVFREAYGMTPMEYRKKYKVADFSSAVGR